MSEQRNITDVQVGYRGRAFTSDLNARGLWLMFDKKFEPLGMVMGNCAYSLGTLHPLAVEIKGSFHGEFRKRYGGVARMVALARMRFKADELGADGIIGIHSKVEYLHNNRWIEITLSGTAVRYAGKSRYTPSRQQEQKQVVVSSSLSPLQPA
jgi:uncharacterized protein YbjQ (UPF0145 family)